MTEFNISIFLQIMQTGLIENNTQIATGILLLESIAIDDEAFNIDGKMITNLVKRNRDVLDIIKKTSAEPDVITNTVHYFEDIVLPDLNPHLKDDVCSRIIHVLKSDSSVSKSRADELVSLYDNDETAEFLAMCFLYAIARPNKKEGSYAGVEDVTYILEMGNRCPICSEYLTELVKTQTLKNYDIATMNPSIHQSPSYSNRIALCKKCSEKYSLDTESAEYQELPAIKAKSAHKYRLDHELSKMTLEREIKDTVVALGNIREVHKLEKLNLNAVRVDQKILPENAILLDDLTTYVLKYFYFIKNAFSETDNFESIALEVRKAFLRLEKNCQTQEEVVKNLGRWIWEQTGLSEKHERACDIIVAFFVQNCEVFNEIT